MGKTSEINFKIDLDDNQIPEKIEWKATDSGKGYKEAKSILLSIWDPEEKNALQIDLWTQDMRLDEMDAHFFQTLLTLADSYQRATKSEVVMTEMKKFCDQLAEKISSEIKEKNKR